MRTRCVPRGSFVVAVLLALGIAGPARAATFHAVTDTNELVRFDSATPGSPSPPVPITGLQMGETILGIDLRPQNGALYALGSTGRLYVINRFSGAASAPPSAFAPIGTGFGVDFNPVPDRLRVVSDQEQNLRLNPADGTVVTDSQVAYGTGDANFGANPSIVGAAYTNNFFGATSTTLYDIDSQLDALVRQDPPNAGTLATVGPLGAGFTATTGFDVLDDGTAWATAGGSSNTILYEINLATGQATMRGTVPEVLVGLTGEPTGAAGPLSGRLERLAGNQLQFNLTNDGARPIEFLALDLMDGFTVDQVSINSGPQAQCNPFPSSAAAGCGPFPGPAYWAGGGQALGILLETDTRYPDNGGVQLRVCAAPCSPFFRDDGPFSFGGPVPPTGDGNGGPAPTGGSAGPGPTGGGAGTLPGDFNGDGVVDAADYVLFRARPGIGLNGVTLTAQAPDGVPPVDALDYDNWRVNYGRSTGARASQRRRATTLVNTRRRVTLRGGQRKRVRLPLTRAGRRFIRGYKRQRLRVTIRVRVRHRPAVGAPTTRTFRRTATLRVQRKRR